MSTYELLLAIHIIAAATWVGGGVTVHIIGRRTLKTGDRQRMDEFTDMANWIGTRFYAPTSLVLLIAGILLVSETPYDHSDTWVMLGYAGWLISFLIGVLYYSRSQKRQKAIIAGEGLESPAFEALYRQVMNVNTFELTILLLVIADMAIKPGS